MTEGYEQACGTAAAEAEERLAAAANLDTVAGIERELLGRRSQFTEAKRRLGDLDPGERAAAGRRPQRGPCLCRGRGGRSP